jgi:hypothetical protein
MKLQTAAMAAMGFFGLQSVQAGPADYVFTPTVEEGEKELEVRFGTADSDPQKSAVSVALGYGINAWWFSEVAVQFEREASESVNYGAFEWENKFQLTQTGKYPVDIGLITEIEIPKERQMEGLEFRFGPLFQTEFSRWQLNGNLLFERHFDGEQESKWDMGYQLQMKYRMQPSFEFGLQGFGEMGEWNHWERSEEQSHKFGPAVFGKLPVGRHQSIEYNAAWLIGLSDGAEDNTLRMQVEYEF